MGEPGQNFTYSGKQPAASRPLLTVAVQTARDSGTTPSITTVPFEKLDAYLKENAGHQIRLAPGSTCWPQPPSPEGTKTCVTAGKFENGELQVEVHETFGGDRDSRSRYNVTAAGITPLSYSTVHGMEALANMFGIGIAGLFGFLLGMKLGEKVAEWWEPKMLTALGPPPDSIPVMRAWVKRSIEWGFVAVAGLIWAAFYFSSR